MTDVGVRETDINVGPSSPTGLEKGAGQSIMEG